jgi:orotate phosphoribosyltransferase
MTENDVLKIFAKHDALLNGHFKLSSGLHSEKYLQCALVLQYPKIAENFAKELAGRFSEEKIDLVVGPALGGVTLAYEIARALGVRGIFTERQEASMVLRRGFAIEKGERVLVAEDVVTTGGSTKEVIDAVEKLGAIIAGVASVINRSSGEVNFGVKYEYLARVKADTFNESNCPMCKLGTQAVKPGSRK